MKNWIAVILLLVAFQTHAESYQRTAAAAYANKYAEVPNSSEYPVFELDCTNYASQALIAGGARMSLSQGDLPSGSGLYGQQSDWFIKKSDKDIYTSNNKFSTKKKDYITRSASWGLADGLYYYLLRSRELGGLYSARPTGTILAALSYNSTSSADQLFNAVKPHLGKLKLGDLVFFDAEGQGRFSHATVVTRIDSDGSVYISYHSAYKKDRPIRGFIDAMVDQRESEAPYIISLVAIDLHGVYDYVGSKYIASIKNNSSLSASSGWIDRLSSMIGIGTAFAQSDLGLKADINQPFVVRVDGNNFDGNELLDIEGSTCDSSAVERGTNYFLQRCVGGQVPGDAKKIRAYDLTYGLDIRIAPEYQTMSLRGPVLAPQTPTLADQGSGTVRLVWQPVSGASGYVVYRDSVEVSTTGSVLAFDDVGRPQGVQACYRIRAISNGVLSSFSPEACITPAAASCIGQWTASSYQVGQSESTTQSCQAGYQGLKTLSHVCQSNGSWGATSIKDTCAPIAATQCDGVWTSAKYSVGAVEEKFENTCPVGTTGKVRSFHTCQAGGVWSATANSDNCTAVLLPPGSPRVASVSGGIQVTWLTASGATGYNVYRDGTRVAAVSGGLTSSVIDTGVSNGVRYCYEVEASSTYTTPPTISDRVSAGCATYSSGPPALLAPTNVSASQIFGGGLRITWSPSAGADGYVLTRQNDSNEWNLSSSTTSYDDFGVTPGIGYSYVVQAKRGSERSPQSSQGNAMAPYVPVNGACGSAHNVAASQAPSANLCSAGTASSVSGSGPWGWSCSGVYGGTTASCSAPLAPPAGPVVSGFTPKFGTRGSTPIVTVTGTGLPDSLALAIANATCTNRGLFSSTTTQQFDCAISSTAPTGMALVTVKDRPGGTVLFQPSLSQGFDIR